MKEEDVKEDVQEQDEEDDEDDEDDEEAEEDKGDGSAHSVVVADLNEAPGERGALENSRRKPDEPGEDEGKGEGDQDEEKKKLKRRKPNTCLPQSNQRSNKL